MKKDLIKKEHFVFGSGGLAFLILNKTHSNIFITLTDYKMKVIICKTSGASNVGFTKKKKSAPQAVERIVKELAFFFKIYGIKFLDIILRFKVTSHTLILVKELSSLGVGIRRFLQRLRIGHNGMRGRKLRRI
jgi:ribosomal protein S11